MDMAVSLERQRHVFLLMDEILSAQFNFEEKDEARSWFNQLRQVFLDYNVSEWNSESFKKNEAEIRSMLQERTIPAESSAVDAVTQE